MNHSSVYYTGHPCIPIYIYTGDTYNIPVSIQVRQNHPQSAPHVYVKPTADMEIVVSDMVKDTGRVNIPYLSEWNQVCNKYGGCGLV